MKRVVICGSRRFEDEIKDFAAKLRDEGVIVHTPLLADIDCVLESAQSPKRAQLMASGLSKRLTDAIRMADIVFIFNKDGYIGVSTAFAIGYAQRGDTPVWFLEDPPNNELWQRDESEMVLNNPQDVAHFLKD
ncbi:MAG: hypothetical protein WC242_00485 [Candidatus Paceibacterota bacterium]|jgi:hypothetical protein